MSFETESSEMPRLNTNGQFYTTFQNNYHYYNLNNQLKIDLEQQNAIKMQQLEAIKLIQLSIDKLTSSTPVPLHNQTGKPLNHNKSTVLVYKETNLHKNLLVSKILNKAKFYYYQSLVQTMRLSLVSKLNYYSNLIQQMQNNVNKNGAASTNQLPIDENTLIDEMKMLMQQLINESSHFNSAESNPQQTQHNNELTNQNFSISNNENRHCINNNKRQLELLDDNNNIKCLDNNNNNLNSVKRHRKCADNEAESMDGSSAVVVVLDENNNAILSDETNVSRSHGKLNTKISNKRFKNSTNFSINKLKTSSTTSPSSFLFHTDNLTTQTPITTSDNNNNNTISVKY